MGARPNPWHVNQMAAPTALRRFNTSNARTCSARQTPRVLHETKEMKVHEQALPLKATCSSTGPSALIATEFSISRLSV